MGSNKSFYEIFKAIYYIEGVSMALTYLDTEDTKRMGKGGFLCLFSVIK